MVKKMEHFCCVRPVHLAEEKALGTPSCSLSVFKEAYKKDGEKHFSKACSDRRRDNLKLKDKILRLDIRKNFFTVRMVKNWNGFPREVVDFPSLEAFKARSNAILTSLV